jgi:hypothetical protein
VPVAEQRPGGDDDADEDERHHHAHHDAGGEQGTEHGAAIVGGDGDRLEGAAPGEPPRR